MTDHLPPNDTFDAGTPTYNSYMLAYLSVEPDNTSYNYGKLHNYYSGSNAPAGRRGSNAASIRSGAGGADTDPQGWVHRRTFSQNISVRASFYVNMLKADQAYTTDRMSEFGVMARVQGGTKTSEGSAGNYRISDVDCYIFRLRGVSGPARVEFEMVRCNAGVETVLDTVTSTAADAAAIDWTQPFDIRMTLNGADYVCWIENYVLNGVMAGPTKFFEGTDSSPLTGQGRCGITMSNARTYTTPNLDIVDICESWGVASATDEDAFEFRDEWIRAIPDQAALHSADAFGNQGRSLMSSFTHDQYSGTQTLQRDSGAVMWDPADTGFASNLFLSMRKADDRYRQHRSIAVTFNAGTSTQHAAGVFLRGDYGATTGVPTDPNTAVFRLPSVFGYMAYAVRTASDWRIGIRRFNGASSGLATIVAELSSGTALFPITSPFTLEFDIRPAAVNAPSGDIDTAYPEMRIYIDSVQQVLVAIESTATADGNGTILDGASNRLSSGYGEGFFGGVDTCTRTIRFDTWTQGLLDTDLTPVVVSNEGTPVDTINDVLKPQYSVTTTHTRDVIEAPFASGHRFAGVAYTLSRRIFTFRAPTTTGAEHHAIQSFFDTKRAVEGAFFYEDESGVAIPAAFISGTLRRSQQAPGVFGTEFQLIELVNTA